LSKKIGYEGNTAKDKKKINLK